MTDPYEIPDPYDEWVHQQADDHADDDAWWAEQMSSVEREEAESALLADESIRY